MLTAILSTRRNQLSEAEQFFADQERPSGFAHALGLVAALDAACVVCMLFAA